MDFTRAKFKIEDAASKLCKRHTKDSYIGLIKVQNENFIVNSRYQKDKHKSTFA